MLFQLSKNAFVRQYGPFTYILGRVSNFDEVYIDAEVFMRWITRSPIEKTELLQRIATVYSDVDRNVIEHDFDEFISPLVNEKIVLSGNDEAAVQMSEETFSYDVEYPKTEFIGSRKTHTASTESTPTQVLLEEYFAVHPTIFDIQMDITQACTERCVHCYIPEYNPIFLPYEIIVKVIDEFRSQGGICLTLSGGECMLHPDFEKIIRYARSKDLIVGVLSNLTLCDESMVHLLRETEATVQVSLYSMKPHIHDHITNRKGSWRVTKMAIEKLRAAQVPCMISCPTMKQNYKDYLDVLAFARSLRMHAQTDFVIMGKMNCDTSNLRFRLDLNETRHILEDIVLKSLPVNNEYFDPKKKEFMQTDEEWGSRKVCGACVSSVCLDATGYYYPCPAFAGVNLGSCYEHDLKWIWYESPETLRIRGVTGKDFPKCLHCQNRDYCSVCMCRNFNETGDMFTPAEHFCKVAAINHEIVDEKQRQMIEGANATKR